MFHLLGRIVSRYWLLFLVGWLALLGGSRLLAPPWRDVAQDLEFAFLPPGSPSRLSEEIYQQAFPEDPLASNVVLVVHREHDTGGDLASARAFIEDVLEPGLRQIAEEEGGLAGEGPAAEAPLFGAEEEAPAGPAPPRSIITRIRTPNAPGVGALLVSPDGQVLLVVVELTTEFLSDRNWPTIARIEELVRTVEEQGKVPAGVTVAVTGSAVIGRDHTLGQMQSARATETLTVLLVVGLLVLIYRAPLLALIPLATVYLSVQMALNLLALLAGAGHINLFEGIQIYITILTYGAGVDYCLFLTARYKELLDQGVKPAEAVAGAVGDVGAALAASAATVICGIGMLMFAEFGKFREAGVAIPLSIFLVLCATLTFSTALLRLAGRWAFWPQPHQEVANGVTPKECRGLRDWLFRKGCLHWGWEQVERIVLQRPAALWGATVALMAPFAVAAVLLHNHLSYDLVGNLPAEVPSVVGTRVLQEHMPAGVVGPVTVLLTDPRLDFETPRGREVVGHIMDRLLAQREHLGLADVRSLTAPLGITLAAGQPLDGLDIPAEVRREALAQAALERYTTDLGERTRVGTRLDLILQDSPFARESVEGLEEIRQVVRAALPPDLRDGAGLHFVGPTASVRDLRDVMQRDRVRIQALVLASVLLVLVLMLRQVVVSIYLLLTVLFSYYTTLGVTFAVFWLLDPQGFTGLDWKVAIFLFTILIAVGEDYNILLMARIDQETHRYGPVRGVTEALVRTGPIISSCGLIMAGTFASLLAGSLTEMKQLGFALAFGILLDTFVVRSVLVPAFLVLWRSGRLLPGHGGERGPDPAGERDRPRQPAYPV